MEENNIINCLGKRMDKIIDSHDYDSMQKYASELEGKAKNDSTCACTEVYYYIGTAYSVLADYYRRQSISEKENAKRDNTERSDAAPIAKNNSNGCIGKNVTKFEKEIEALKHKEKSYRRLSFSFLRKAMDSFDENTRKELRSSVFTNYANELDICGRTIEALRIYRKAIELYPCFAMLRGNYGRALNYYAGLVNDEGHYRELHFHAYQSLRLALESRDPNMTDRARSYFGSLIENYESLNSREYLSQELTYKEYDLGETEERGYRLWCLHHHLFLNPLNDLIETESAFAHDPLTISHITEHIDREKEVEDRKNGDPPTWFSMLNQLKEEYVVARYLCYEGSESRLEVHYADKEVTLALGDFNYVNYSIRLEFLKSAFKNLFSIFDQVAFFINEYWEMGIKEREADAKHVFKSKKFPHDNLVLEALYWSNCELTEKYGEADTPFDGNLKKLRNAMEHKFVKVHAYSTSEPLKIEDDRFYHLSEDELIKQTMRMLELSREWIMGLVYAINLEERRNEQDDDGLVAHMAIANYEDQWKI